MTDAQCIEVVVTWGDEPSAAVLAVAFVRRGERLEIGAGPACDALLPSEAKDLVGGGVAELTLASGLTARARVVDAEPFPEAVPALDGFGFAATWVAIAAGTCLALAAHDEHRAGEPDVGAQLAVMRRLLAASDARDPPRPPSAPRPRARAWPDSAEAPTKPADAPPTTAAAKPEEASGFGIVGFLPARSRNLREDGVWRDRLAALDDDARTERVREMFTPVVGGYAAELGGTGLGGGGKGAGIDLVDVGGLTARAMQDAARMREEDEAKGGFAHVRVTRARLPLAPSAGPPPIQPIPRPVIERAVRASGGRLRMCYGLGLQRDPNLAGRVDVAFTIGAGGAVSEARDAGGDLSDDVVRQCVVRTFYGLAFPAPMRDVPQKTVFPVVFGRTLE